MVTNDKPRTHKLTGRFTRLLKETFFLAFDDSLNDGLNIVGQSALLKSDLEHELKTGLTAVSASHQRKGIAQSLKLIAARTAIEKGYTQLQTVNHAINRPMLTINEAMGFQKQNAIIELRKNLNTKF